MSRRRRGKREKAPAFRYGIYNDTCHHIVASRIIGDHHPTPCRYYHRRGKASALSVFTDMMIHVTMLCIGDYYPISRRRHRCRCRRRGFYVHPKMHRDTITCCRCHRPRVHSKMCFGLPPYVHLKICHSTITYKMFCLGDTSLMCFHSSFFQGQKH